jgi:hypothetical protein
VNGSEDRSSSELIEPEFHTSLNRVWNGAALAVIGPYVGPKQIKQRVRALWRAEYEALAKIHGSAKGAMDAQR